MDDPTLPNPASLGCSWCPWGHAGLSTPTHKGRTSFSDLHVEDCALFPRPFGVPQHCQTHYSLLCMSSIRSVNSTSRLRSQKPFTS